MDISPDLALARRAALRDEAAWREILAMARELLFGAVWRYGLDEAREDLLQDVMERLVRKIGTYRGESPLRAWVASVCYNRLRNAHRAARHERRIVGALPADAPERAARTNTDAAAIRRSDHALAMAAMAGLAGAHRDVVRLRIVSDLSVEETARRLGLREGTVKSRLSRALFELRLFVLVLGGATLADAARASGMSLPAARRRVMAVLPAWRRQLPRPLVSRIERRIPDDDDASPSAA